MDAGAGWGVALVAVEGAPAAALLSRVAHALRPAACQSTPWRPLAFNGAGVFVGAAVVFAVVLAARVAAFLVARS